MISSELLERTLSSVVGQDRVLVDPKALTAYSKGGGLAAPGSPLLAVQPETDGQVQELVRLANRLRIPLTPWSSGKNNQGSSLPSPGGIVLDLSRMTAILEIDEDNRNARIEPGVTFARLQEEAKGRGLRVLTPVELPAAASVLTTYLELNPLYSWPKYGFETLLNMEMILGNGERLRTGNAASPLIEKGYDPHSNPYVILGKIWYGAQGTLCVATAATVILKSRQEVNKPFLLGFRNLEDSFALLREIQKYRIGEELFLANAKELASILSAAGPGLFQPAPAPWNLVLVVRGTEAEVRFQEEDLRDILDRHEKCVSSASAVDAKLSAALLKEIESPSGWEGMTARKSGAAARATLPLVAAIETLPNMNILAESLCERHGYDPAELGCFLLPAEIGRVHYHFSFSCDPGDAEQTGRCRTLYNGLAAGLIKRGAFFSRPAGRVAEMVYQRTPAYYNTLKVFKELFDPNAILNPGKVFVL